MNFHATPEETAEVLDQRLAAWAKRHRSIHVDELEARFEGERPASPRPGLILAFFNGYRDNYEVAAPLLERHGFRGWFYVPTRWPSVSEADQRDYALAHGMGLPAAVHWAAAPGRLALTWDEVRDLDARGHVIASHTRSHVRVDATNRARLEEEIVGSQQDLERELGQPAKVFAWLQGSAYGENPHADHFLRKAGYRFLVSNLKIEHLS